MASASTSSGFGKECSPFDVFINCRGPDTKKGLASHLYHMLTGYGLRVFLDTEELQPGDNLIRQIKEAITTASVHIAIFSPRYAESRWSLDELVQIVESRKTIIPVFYKVNPSDLRRTRGGDGVYARSLRKKNDDSEPRYDSHTLEKWREALSAVAGIRGFMLDTYDSDEARLVEEVVEEVLRKVPKPPLDVAKYPTGLNDKAEDFERTVLSHQQSENITVVGIVGMCGVGKTTLAKELFNRHRSKYDRSCFLVDVREEASRGYLNVLQSRLLKDLTQLDVHISRINEGLESLRMHLPRSQRVLVVIDDVDDTAQLDAFFSPIQCTLAPSSLILVTSRDKGVLTSSGIKESLIYKLTGLDREHSRELFCSHAFNQPYPAPGFERLVEKFLNVCDGLPLSLSVIGALLYGMELEYWKAQFNRISKILPREILSRLQISYDSLDNEEKQIFLDAACFFIGEDRDTAIRIWDGSHWPGWLFLRNLEDKCLLEVDSENCIRMHNQVRDLGREIAEKVTPHRLWRSDDIVYDNSPVRGISMVHETDPEESFEIPTNISRLQLLRAHGNTVERIFGNARSPQLVWLSWYSCPFSSLPSWISVKNLRVLHVQGENLKTMWEDESQAPIQLRELDIDANILNVPKSIGNLKHLEKFVLRRRKYFGADTVDLETLPDEVRGMHSLKHLELVGCKNLRFLPDSAGNWTILERIDLDGCSSLLVLPESAGNWTSLQRIDLGGCSSLWGLPESAGNWTSLQQIGLGGCSSVWLLPESAGNWTSLQRIDLGGCSYLRGLPYSAGNWTSLQRIDLGRCSSMVKLPESAGNWMSLQRIDLSGCSSLQWLPELAGNWTSLQRIDLGGCSTLRRLPDTAGNWATLQQIDLSGCDALQEVPDSAGNWTSLQRIDLGRCSTLQRLPDSAGNWTSLQQINLGGCQALQELPESVGNWTSLQRIDLGERFPQQKLPLADNWKSKGLPESMGNWTHLKYSLVGSSPLLYASSISNYVYDVFINCHGPDVKRTFANHLHRRFVYSGLRPFVDEEEMSEEDSIAPQIKEAIATASVHVAIFSRRYAESRRCLDELLLMLESGAPVIPIFYNVKRRDLQSTDGVYGRALQNHEKRTTYDSQASEDKQRDNSNTIEEWRKALSIISGTGISGFELQAFEGDEGELLDAVVESVLKSVRKAPLYEVSYLKGLDQMVEDFEKKVLLRGQSGKPRVVGIVGVAGVGKTTLAKELSNRKSSSFNRACILFDVSGTVARCSLHFLQRKLFKDLTNLDIQIDGVAQGKELFTKHGSSIYGATALVILDNVDNAHQLEALLPVPNCLPHDSLILITSRCEDVLTDFFTNYGVEQSSIYNLTDQSLDKDLSCLDKKAKQFAEFVLQQQGKKPQVVGIVGIGGIGKTRLAMEFFNRKSSDYEKSCFLYDVNETARTSFSIHNLLSKLLSKLLQGSTQLDLQVQGVDEGINLLKKHVSSFRCLVILDNVAHWHQLDTLLSVLTFLRSDSLILITCREEEVLKCSGVQQSSIYKLDRLEDKESKEVFCTHAFGEPSPRQGFEDLADKFVKACNGLPLTLRVLGALLWGKTNSSYWKERLDKLPQRHTDQIEHTDHIEKSLKICYDDLDKEEKMIFLHIACCCIGEERNLAVRLWDASGSRGLSVFENLQKRCLVDVDGEDCLIMHECLRELGRTIADEKGLRHPPQPRSENDSDLLRRSSSTRLTITVRAVITMITAMMIWNMRQRNRTSRN